MPTTRPLTSAVRSGQAPGEMRLSGPVAGPDADALRHVGRLATRLLQAPAAAVTHAVGDTLNIFGFTPDGAPFAMCTSLPLEDTACVEVLRSGLPMLLDDVDLLPAAPHLAALRAVGMRAYAGVPLRNAEGTPIGTLCILDALPRHWSAADREMLKQLAPLAELELRRLAATRSLEESLALLRSIVHGSTDVIFVKDREGRYLLANPSMLELHGCTEAELLGHRVEELLPPAEAAAILLQDQRVIDTGETLNTEHWLTPGGVRRRYLTVRGPYRNWRGECVGVFGVSRDITEREADASRIRESEELHRLVAQVTREALWDVDLVTGRVVRGEGYQRLLGYPPEELTGGEDWWREQVHPDDRELVVRDYDAALAGTATELEAEYRLRRADGSYVRVADWSRFLRDSEGRAIRVVGSLQDITIQAATRMQYERLIGTIDGIVWEADPETFVFSFVSPQAERLLGYPLAQWLEPGFWASRLHPDDRDEALSYCVARTREGQSHVMEYRMLAQDGRVLWFRDLVTVTVARGKPVGLSGIMMDISEQKRTEEALRQREDQLRQAQKMEAVGRLAGGIAHDFNNLLTAIVGYSDLLHETLENDPRGEEVLEIRRAADRATQLTRQLLAFSRKQVLQPVDLDAQEVVLSLASLLRRLIGEHLRLETRLTGTAVWVHVDRGQLEQVIINLAVNARDAMPNGGVLTITVGTVGPTDRLPPALEGALEPPVAVISIEDTGVGMDAHTVARLFEPFFTTKEVGQGTGLGLATVYGIVRQSGGEIRVESSPGSGTAFHIFLPLVARPAAVAATRVGDQPARGGDETLLLIEDDPAVRRLTGSVLRGLGYHVIEAATGQAALMAARQHTGTVHLILTDMVMPGLSGPETAAALADVIPGCGVLYMSGYPLTELARSGVQLQPAQLLQKPFAPDELARRVREVLDRLA